MFTRSTGRSALAAILCLAAASLGAPASAQAGAALPVPLVGTMQDIPDAHEKPDPTLQYKLVFSVETLAESSDSVSPALQAIGGLINTYRKYGVPADHIQATAVFHGATIVLVTRDETYRRRTGSEKNPNLPILQQLASAGVDLVVCGQSALSQHYATSDLIPVAKLNLSATVTFVNLQTRGFVKIQE